MPPPPADPTRRPAPTPLHPALDHAVRRVQHAAREAAQRTVDSLGLAALSTLQHQQRDALLTAQYELNRKLGAFLAAFDAAFEERLRGVGTGGSADDTTAAAPDWESMHLVEDSEVEAQISADRFGMDIAHACEWELREIEAYLGGLLPPRADGGPPANPLRPEIVGHAMVRGVAAVTDGPDTRRLLAAELGRSLAPLLRAGYGAIVGDWRQAGLRPAGLSVRRNAAHDGERDGRDERDPGRDSERDAHHTERDPRGGTRGGMRDSERGGSGHGRDPSVGAAHHDGASAGGGGGSSSGGVGGGWRSHTGDRFGTAPVGAGGFAVHPSARGGQPGAAAATSGYGSAVAAGFGRVDPALGSMIRRLASQPAADGAADDASTGHGASTATGEVGGDRTGGVASFAPPPNLIHAHRDELRQAAHGALDHLVIDVIGFLFDQILSDPKVPPQMARMLARLQLPVLRAALGDPAFFSSRRHPVRRFVNRIASLGAAFDDFGDDAARAFLVRVRALVDDVVAGDFEQPALYEQQLAALEALVAEHGSHELRDAGTDAAEVLTRREDEQRLHRLYAERLGSELRDVAAPAFLRDFVARVWSRVLLRAAERDGGRGELSTRLRQAGRELLLSVQPKATPAQRKLFLADLPRLMQDLTAGMDLVGWPAADRHAFFGELMPAHGEALKATSARTLDINLMARHVDGALSRALPTREEARRAGPLPVLVDALPESLFSGDEAERIGLVREGAVDWSGPLDIDLDQVAAEAEAQPAAVVLPAGLPEMPTGAEAAAASRQFAERLQVGCVYRMHLDGEWHKVRLAHVSEGRSFCIFTRGPARHRRTLSMTQRMLVRLCEAGRLRPIEQASLIERATSRARRQLAQLGAAVRA